MLDAGRILFTRQDIMLYMGRILYFTRVGYYALYGQDIMLYTDRKLCFTRVGYYALYGQDIMLYMGRILCFIYGYRKYALYMGTENMLYAYALREQDIMLYMGRVLCFTLVGYYVLRRQDIMNLAGRILSYTCSTNCTYCGGDIEDNYPPAAICIAILLFPVGIIGCLLLKERQCVKCNRTSSQILPVDTKKLA